jgi:hypothetical protein
MRRHLAVLCGLVAVAALVPTGSAITKPQVFNLLDITVRDVPIDPGFGENEVPRVGARSAFTDALYKWAGTKRGACVGRAEGLCTFVKVDPSVFEATVYCTVNAYLPAGQILIAGFSRFAENSGPTFRLPVVGGVGAYAGVRDYIKATSIGGEDSSRSNIEFHLMP